MSELANVRDFVLFEVLRKERCPVARFASWGLPTIISSMPFRHYGDSSRMYKPLFWS